MDKSKLLANWLKQKSVDSESLSKKPEDSPNRLSYGQRSLYFLQHTYPDDPFYNYPELYTLRGNWDIEIFKQCVYEVCQSHDVFFHNFKLNSNHEPEVIINRDRDPVIIEHVDQSEVSETTSLNDFFLRKGRIPFDLADDTLCRVTVVSVSDSEYQVLFTLNHIITDEWSMKLFRDQLIERYRKRSDDNSGDFIRDNGYDYLDYCHHQINTKIPEQEIEYWKDKLSEPNDEMQLPVDKHPSKKTHRGKLSTITLPPDLSEKIKLLAKEQDTTLFSFFLSAYNVLLHRYSGDNTIHIGTPISNRNRQEWETIFGFFIETVLLKSSIDSKTSFTKYLETVKREVLEAFDHKKVPYETIVSQLSTQREVNKNPLFRSMFLFIQKEKEKQPLPGLEMEYRSFDIGVAKFDLSVFVEEQNGNFSITFEYATDLFENDTIVQLQNHLQALLHDIVLDPEQPIIDLSIYGTEDLSKFEKWNATEFDTKPITIDKAFEEIVQQHPSSIAVTDSNSSLTYYELNARANALANEIRIRSISGKRIGLLLGRQSEMIVAMLGVLKSGQGYVPLDPSYPPERIQYIIDDAGIDLIISSSILASGLNIDIAHIDIDLITAAPELLFKKTENVQNEAYVIYTSGSTGKPKGVSISHKNLYNSTFARPLFYENKNPSCFLLFSSFSFDSSIAGIYWTLLTGGHLIISGERAEQDIQKVALLIRQKEVSHILLLPSLYQVLLQETETHLLNSLEIVIVAGEVCSTGIVDLHFNKLPETNLSNEYGPTEATVWSIAHHVSPEDSAERVPIGYPVPGSKAYILDRNHKRVPIGVTGELYLGGEGISSGYIGNASADNDRLIDNPFGKGKLYRTGDLASHRRDGKIDFWGRVDDQIKIRGHRVELKEIERTLSSFNHIDRSAVIYDDSKQQVLAFIIQNKTYDIDENKVRERLKTQLPEYMIPSTLLLVDEFPHLPNGKLDKNSLIELTTESSPADDEPASGKLTSIESELIDIWKEVLDQSIIGINDNFFALGGDSISSIRMVSKAKSKGIHLSPTQIFETQTIKEISIHLEEQQEQTQLPEPSSKAPLSPIQHWFFDFYSTDTKHWHQILEFETALNKTEFEWKSVFKSIVERHKALRSCFKSGQQFFYDDLSSSVNNDFIHFFLKGNLEKLTYKVIQETNLESTNLFQVLILSGKNKTTIRLVAHHLIVDIISYNQLLQEISAVLSDQSLSRPHNQYSQFSNYLKNLSEKGFFNEELAFWKSQFSQHEFWDTYYQADIRQKDLGLETITLPEEITKDLIQVSKNSNYKPEEVVLVSILKALNLSLGLSEILVGFEHNGRDLPQNISFSDSIGWFTSLYPINFTLKEGETETADLIKTLRKTPNLGIGFGVLKYITKEKSLQHFNRFPITYNYVGRLEAQHFNCIDSYTFITKGARNDESEVFSPFDFSVAITENQLQVNLRHPENIFSKKDASDLLSIQKKQLLSLIEQLQTDQQIDEGINRTLSDSDLDELSKLFEL